MDKLKRNPTIYKNRKDCSDRLPLPKGVLWDWDGVVVNTIGVHAQSISQILTNEGYAFDYEFFLSLVGIKDQEVIEKSILRQNPTLEKEEIVDFIRKIQACYEELVRLGCVHVYAGVEDWVNFFHSLGIHQVIASSTTLENIRLVLGKISFGDRFQMIVSGGPDVKGKPEPDIFLRGCEQMHLYPEECLVFEDTTHGIEAARRARIPCIAISNTYPPEDLMDANIVVSSLENLEPGRIFSIRG